MALMVVTRKQRTRTVQVGRGDGTFGSARRDTPRQRMIILFTSTIELTLSFYAVPQKLLSIADVRCSPCPLT